MKQEVGIQTGFRLVLFTLLVLPRIGDAQAPVMPSPRAAVTFDGAATPSDEPPRDLAWQGAQPADPQRPHGQSTVRPLAVMSMDAVFEPLDRLPNSYRPSSTTPPPRDPYFGSTNRRQFSWQAANLAHRTLYYEEARLERLGQTRAPLLQPTLSWLVFIKNALTVPYRVHYDRPYDVHYTLGHPRPGTVE